MVNQISLSGQVYKLGKPRKNAAEVLIQEIWLIHKSTQFNGLVEKPINVLVLVRFVGALAEQAKRQISLNQELEVSGYLDHRPSREQVRQLCIYAQSFKEPDSISR